MKSSGIKLPEVHGVSKGLDLHTQSGKQVIKPMIPNVPEHNQLASM